MPAIRVSARVARHWESTHHTFPVRLREVHSPPRTLYTLGNRELLNAPCVAIVGTRRPTPYGTRVAQQLATVLVRHGACIVSGMAAGIDGIAHRAALQEGGATAAVLGAGIDEVYPTSHAALYNDIVERGLVVSEFGPGRQLFRGCFPRRNRIIAGLSILTIVVEAGPKSGSLITATYASDAGRTVAAVPGPIDSPQSHATNQLIRDGAQVIASVDDAVGLLRLLQASACEQAAEDALDLSPDESAVLDAVPSRGASPNVITLEGIVVKAGLPAARCMSVVTMLELRGVLECLSSGEVKRR